MEELQGGAILTGQEFGAEERWRLSRSLVHEMRSVLTVIKIAGEVLSSARADDPRYRATYAGMISQQTGRVARLLEDFSEVVRPIGSLETQEPEMADLNVALYAAGTELVGLAQHVGVEIELVPASNAALLVGEQIRLTQAVRGILEYLLVATSRGGTVSAAVDVPVVESEAIEVVFGCTQPVERPATPLVLDWGRIGLAAARCIVERHGGRIYTSLDAERAPVVLELPRLRGVEVGPQTIPIVHRLEGRVWQFPPQVAESA